MFDFSDSGWLAPHGPGAKFVCQIPGQLDDSALCDGQWTVCSSHSLCTAVWKLYRLRGKYLKLYVTLMLYAEETYFYMKDLAIVFIVDLKDQEEKLFHICLVVKG